MVLSKSKKRSAFQVGSIVIVKKSNLKGTIIDTLGRKKWKVELTLDGHATVADYTSQQIRHPKDHELQDDSNDRSQQSLQVPTTSDEQTGVEPVLVSDQAQPPFARVATREPRVLDAEVTSVLDDSDSEDMSFSEILHDADDDESVNLQVPYDSDDDIPPLRQCQKDDLNSDSDDDDDEDAPPHSSPAYESDNDEEDPDEDLSEDLPSRNTVTAEADETEADISGATFAAQLEPEDDKYQRKQEFYKLDKQKLIDDKWTVKKKPSKQNKLAIGSTVQERSGAKRSGLIVGDGNGELTWMVQFEGSENDEQFSSFHLKLVQDNSEYVWSIVKDSSPEQNKAVTEYRDIGLLGIHFGDFSDTSLSNTDYDYPYLRLLQTLWPGKFKQLQVQYKGNVTLIVVCQTYCFYCRR
jgi:hypothetical protein